LHVAGFLNSQTEAVVRASAKFGCISLKAHDWFSAMKMTLGSNSEKP
jgi:hypothetical protein